MSSNSVRLGKNISAAQEEQTFPDDRSVNNKRDTASSATFFQKQAGTICLIQGADSAKMVQKRCVVFLEKKVKLAIWDL